MSKDLLNHIGFFEQDIDLTTLLRYTKVLYFFSVLIQYVVFYHVASFLMDLVGPFFPEATLGVKRAVAAGFWDLCIYFLKLNNVNFTVSGDKVDSESSVLVSNHQSLADHIAIAYLAKNSARESILIPRVNFFSWFSLWRVPTLRIFINIAKSDENWELEKNLNEVLFKGVLESKIPEWIVVFPEVNIYTQEDSALCKKQSEKYYLPYMENVLYPRFSGAFNVMSVLDGTPNKFTRLYDVTITYSKVTTEEPFGSHEINSNMYSFTAPSLLDTFTLTSPLNVNVHLKSSLLSTVPVKRHKLEKWLEKTWVKKDRLIALQKIGYVDQLTSEIKAQNLTRQNSLVYS